MYGTVAVLNNTVCTKRESGCTPETNVMLSVNYTSIKKKKKPSRLFVRFSYSVPENDS